MAARKKRVSKPKSVKVGVQDIDIVYSGEYSDAIVTYEPMVQGKLVPELKVIHVYEHNNEDMTKNTILHETMHAIDQFMNTGLSEEQILQLTNGLILVGRNNKDFFKYIFCMEE